jgi:staphylococcal nuclease domain-containing protein 1
LAFIDCAYRPSDPKVAGLQAEARETLRKRVIGKVVHVLVDYRKPAEGTYEAKVRRRFPSFATRINCVRTGLRYGHAKWGVRSASRSWHIPADHAMRSNVALALVERGLVNVIRHRRDDEDKSSDIDRLMQAEAK